MWFVFRVACCVFVFVFILCVMRLWCVYGLCLFVRVFNFVLCDICSCHCFYVRVCLL